MSSQLDLDQGGTFRQWTRQYMGPSVGWVWVPVDAVLEVTTGGGTLLARGTSLVTINVDADVNISLPSSKASPAGPQAIPGQWVVNPVTIVDIGGFAGNRIYNIFPAVGETISSLPNVRLRSPYGSIILNPLLRTGGWNLIQ
jgi:hypothetical protein